MMRFIIICLMMMHMIGVCAKSDTKTRLEEIHQKLEQVEKEHSAIYNYLCLMAVGNATVYVGSQPDVLQEKDLIDDNNSFQEHVAGALDERTKRVCYLHRGLFASRL